MYRKVGDIVRTERQVRYGRCFILGLDRDGIEITSLSCRPRCDANEWLNNPAAPHVELNRVRNHYGKFLVLIGGGIL